MNQHTYPINGPRLSATRGLAARGVSARAVSATAAPSRTREEPPDMSWLRIPRPPVPGSSGWSIAP